MFRKLGLLAIIVTVATLFAIPAQAVTIVDLTTDGASGWIDVAYFVQIDPPGAQGTGNFDPFVRIQGNKTERGYNTDGALEFDTKQGTWTHILDRQDPVKGLGVVDGSTVPGLTAGVLYAEFLLDINEAKSNELLSLDAVQIFQSNSPTNTGYPALGTKIFDLGTGNAVILNFALNPGSGQGDMAMYVPYDLFTDRYVYLYSEFGYRGGNEESSDGFEEWGIKVGMPNIPEPSSILALLCGLTGLGGFIARRRS